MARTAVSGAEAKKDGGDSAAAPSAAAPAKAKRSLAGKVRVLDTTLDYPYGTARRPGDVFEMGEPDVKHFLALGAIELVDD